jgi:hypothetical protein
MMSSAISDHPGAPSVTMTWTDSGPGPMEWAGAGVALRVAGQKVSVGLKVQSTGCVVARRPGGGAFVVMLAVLLGFAACRRGGNIGRPVP